MKNGEVRQFQGKKYKYQEIEAMETDMDFGYECCKGCAFEELCATQINNAHDVLGNCYEEGREDGRNGIFIEVEHD